MVSECCIEEHNFHRGFHFKLLLSLFSLFMSKRLVCTTLSCSQKIYKGSFQWLKWNPIENHTIICSTHSKWKDRCSQMIDITLIEDWRRMIISTCKKLLLISRINTLTVIQLAPSRSQATFQLIAYVYFFRRWSRILIDRVCWLATLTHHLTYV